MIRIQKLDRRSRFPVTNLFCYTDKMDVGDSRRDASGHATQSIEKATHTRGSASFLWLMIPAQHAVATEVPGRVCWRLVGDHMTTALLASTSDSAVSSPNTQAREESEAKSS
jgi:hypothetical protein